MIRNSLIRNWESQMSKFLKKNETLNARMSFLSFLIFIVQHLSTFRHALLTKSSFLTTWSIFGQYLLILVNICQYLSNIWHIGQYLSIFANILWYLSIFCDICHIGQYLLIFWTLFHLFDMPFWQKACFLLFCRYLVNIC